MDPTTKDIVTVAIAAWGAVTGTVALLLRIRDTRRDRRSLSVRPHYEVQMPFPVSVVFHVNVVNTGRRPASVDAIFVELPKPSLFRRRPLIRLDTNGIGREIAEGRQAQFDFYGSNLPEALKTGKVCRVMVRDTHGKFWRSKGTFEQDKIQRLTSAEKIDEHSIGDASSPRHVSLRIFSLNTGFVLQQVVKKDKTTRTTHINCDSRSELDSAKQRAIEAAKQYVVGNIENMP